MKGNLNQGYFDPDDLVSVPEEGYVILASGGPLMFLETIEGDNALCSWEHEGKKLMHLFPVACLRKLVKLKG